MKVTSVPSKRMAYGVLAFASLCIGTVQSAEVNQPYVGIVGKQEWLFYQYELTTAKDVPATTASIDLICQFNRVLAKKGITLGVAMVPIKMRIYAEYLPADLKINDFMMGNYERMTSELTSCGVVVFDLNSAFLTNPLRNSATPLFFKMDTHWSNTGAMLAAQSIAEQTTANSVTRFVLAQIPTQAYKRTVSKVKKVTKNRDILQVLPPDTKAKNYAFERFYPVEIIRDDANTADPGGDLLGKHPFAAISLVGSSYSMDWTGFADALRFCLQKDVFSLGVGANQGSWVGLESYLRDDAFQQSPPKLLIWEMPERDMRAPPDYPYREARYITTNAEWLKRVTALVQSAKASAPAQ